MSSSPLATWFIFIQTVIILDANWISGGSTLYPSYNFAVGSYGDAIFLIGGLSFTNFVQRHVVQYEINGDQFTHVKSLLEEDEDIFGSGQFWTQQNEILYTIRPTISDSGTSTFVTFNMNTKQLEFDWNNIQIPINVCQSGCLASSNAHLFVVGGADCASPSQALATLQALRLSTYEWLHNAPSMNTARGDHACIVHSNYLWVFGGDTATNERIDTTNIAVESWNYTAPLPQPIYSLRAVAWEHFIYIIGGWIEPSNVHVALSTMYIMDVQTESITLSPHVLPTATRSAGTILVGDGIYVFGGLDQGGMEITQWMYYKLSTLNPSAATPAPSHVPSHVPSYTTPTPNPSNVPSSAPTGMPSKDPSEFPSSAPSTPPTRYPFSIAIVQPSSTANPTTASPSTTDVPTSAPNDRTSSMPTTVDQPTQSTPLDSSATTSAFLHDFATLPGIHDSDANVQLVLILSSAVILVVLITLCYILWQQQTREKVNAQPKRKGSVSLHEIGMIIEGQAMSVNDAVEQCDDCGKHTELLFGLDEHLYCRECRTCYDDDADDMYKPQLVSKTPFNETEGTDHSNTSLIQKTTVIATQLTPLVSDTETTGGNDNVLEDIHREGEKKIEMRYTHEGPIDIDDVIGL